jgi:hypothetical protein
MQQRLLFLYLILVICLLRHAQIDDGAAVPITSPEDTRNRPAAAQSDARIAAAMPIGGSAL